MYSDRVKPSKHDFQHPLSQIYCLGNAGGYLGLFLGYALLNVPMLLENFYNWMTNRSKQQLGVKRDNITKNFTKEQEKFNNEAVGNTQFYA